MKFTIWYENEQYDGYCVEDWLNLPQTGVVAILEYFGDSRYRISCGSDWYWLDGNDVIQSNTTSDELDQFTENPVPNNTTVKTGKWVSDERMAEVIQELREIIDG